MKAIGALWAVLAGMCIPELQVRADPASELDDAAARLHYAFFTADARAMEDAIALVTQLEAPATLPGMKEYYAAYGYWKLAQIQTDSKTAARGTISKATQACEKQAGLAIAQDRRMAEAHAIAAACAGLAPGLTSSGCAKSRSLRTALELDPANPRVMLIDVLCTRAGSNPGAETEKLRTLLAAFEASPPSRPGKPDWGQAEALVLLGENYLQRGDALAARDAIERALILAPDYRKAQELLQSAAARPK